MTALVRRFLKTAVGFLACGLLLGVWMMARRELRGSYPSPYMVSAHVHAVLVGFVMMMILGVALWMFPRPAKDDRRYKPHLANVAYWLLTAGTAGRIVGELLRTSYPGRWSGYSVLTGGVAQVGGIALFFFTIWPRIRGVTSNAHVRQEERI